MGKRARTRKALPSLALGSPDYRDPVAELGSPTVPADTDGAQITMPVESALAVEDALGPERAQALTSAELAEWLDAHGLPYRWTGPA
ncbi:hypothetical protein [Actinomycetospora soli]|uniref:hypothetical protein n=1 Tax=Actinomycetospora soli TaxID=2893887 RepID=UPI001E5F6948|nr:hypothetical protein [Actinomycetospora soli]MCD2191650.1 hypothetical protein [Actinomycetospora soli]